MEKTNDIPVKKRVILSSEISELLFEVFFEVAATSILRNQDEGCVYGCRGSFQSFAVVVHVTLIPSSRYVPACSYSTAGISSCLSRCCFCSCSCCLSC